MKLTSSQMKYILALWKLDRGDKIRCTDVAKALRVKKPIVCWMLCRLENMGLITQDPYSDIRITEEGRKIMEECQRSVSALAGLLARRLKLSETAAEEMAFLLLGNLDKPALNEIMDRDRELGVKKN